MGDYIGALVKSFESGSLGSLALSSSGNDYGLSCGSYQLTLRWGNCISFIKTYFPAEGQLLYFNASKPDIASATYPGTDYCSSPSAVKAVWKTCYNKVGKDKFFEYEHEFISNQYYEPALKLLKNTFNPNTHSRMAQECIWSWSVHKGASGCKKYFLEACKNINPQTMLAENLIDILYDKRYSVNNFTRYKKGVTNGSSEREILRKFCNVNPLPYSGKTNPSDGKTATGVKSVVQNPATKTTLYIVQVGAYKVKTNADKMLADIKKAGFTDSYISKTGGYYKVLCGAFIVKTNAENHMAAIKKKGFPVIIRTETK